MIPAPTTTRFGVDLITFYDPQFWGVDRHDEIVELAERDPIVFWTRILDGVHAAGIQLIELTFPPADWTSAVRAYGSAAAFRRELESRGLGVKSGFHIPLDSARSTDSAAAADAAEEYAEFIAAAGGDTLVAGLPMRKARTAEPPMFIDHAYMTRIADVLHHVGAATLRHGIRTAVHTEAHSVFCTSRDVDLLMTLTDPEYVFLCPDTGHLTLAGADPIRVLDRHRDRMIIAHWKDAVGAMPPVELIDEDIHIAHRAFFRRVGAGSVDWFRWSEITSSAGVGDVTLLELDAVADPIAEMTAAREYLSTALGLVALAPPGATSLPLPALHHTDRK